MFQEIPSEIGDDGYESEIDVEQTMRGLKCQLFNAVTCKIPDFIEKLDTNDVCWYLIERHKMLKISKVLNCIIIHISVKCPLYECARNHCRLSRHNDLRICSFHT